MPCLLYKDVHSGKELAGVNIALIMSITGLFYCAFNVFSAAQKDFLALGQDMKCTKYINKVPSNGRFCWETRAYNLPMLLGVFVLDMEFSGHQPLTFIL